MMFADKRPKRAQQGSVLVIALLLLLVLTILAVASMSGTIMQERMAGNVNLQTLAFNAASAGVATSINFADPDTWEVDDANEPRTCLRGAGSEWKSAWTDLNEFRGANTPAGTTVAYRQRFGCFEAEDALDHWVNPDDVPLQLLVLNQGLVCSGDDVANCLNGDDLSTQVLSVREIEVRVETRGGDPDCLFDVGPVDPDDMPCSGQGGGNCPIQMPASGQGGEGSRIDARPMGCAIRTAEAPAAEMLKQLRHGSDRTGWYQPQPAVRTGDAGSFWTNKEALATAANAIKIGVRGYTDSDEDLFAACRGRVLTGDPVTTCPSDAVTYPITYVAGTLDLNPGGGSGCRVRGSVLVENGLRFRGQTTYEADFILMGGSLDFDGMGSEVSTGLVKLFNLETPDPPLSEGAAYNPDEVELGLTTKFNISGMGGSQVRANEEDCNAFKSRYENLNSCIEAVYEIKEAGWFDGDENVDPVLDEPDGENAVLYPIPNCGNVGSGGRRDVIASWREYLDRQRW